MPQCAGCGVDVERLILGLCSDCYRRRHGVANPPTSLEAQICRYCGSIRVSGKWVKVGSFREAVETLVYSSLSRLRPSYPLERVMVRTLRYDTKPDWTTRITVELVGVYKDVGVIDYVGITVKLKPSICPTCKTRLSGEYDVLVQIRGSGVNEEEIFEVLSTAGLAERTIDVIKDKDGVNVYFTDMGAASRLAKALRRRYRISIGRVEHEHVGLTRKGKKRSRKTLTIRILGR